MRKRERLLWVLLLAVIPLAVTPAFAGKTAPVSRPLAGSARAVITGSAVGSSPQCSLGITGPAISSVGYIIPGEDQYYTLIDPSECEGGEECGVMVTLAHIQLEFSYGMSTPVRVGLVQADMTDAECPIPVPGSYACAPIEYDLVGPDSGFYDIALPLSANLPLTAPVFLEITFTEWGPYWDVPGLLLTGSCHSCSSYNYYPGDNYDLCTFGFDGNPIMYVETECANPVAQKQNTWGDLKAMYR